MAAVAARHDHAAISRRDCSRQEREVAVRDDPRGAEGAVGPVPREEQVHQIGTGSRVNVVCPGSPGPKTASARGGTPAFPSGPPRRCDRRAARARCASPEWRPARGAPRQPPVRLVAREKHVEVGTDKCRLARLAGTEHRASCPNPGRDRPGHDEAAVRRRGEPIGVGLRRSRHLLRPAEQTVRLVHGDEQIDAVAGRNRQHGADAAPTRKYHPLGEGAKMTAPPSDAITTSCTRSRCGPPIWSTQSRFPLPSKRATYPSVFPLVSVSTSVVWFASPGPNVTLPRNAPAASIPPSGMAAIRLMSPKWLPAVDRPQARLPSAR